MSLRGISLVSCGLTLFIHESHAFLYVWMLNHGTSCLQCSSAYVNRLDVRMIAGFLICCSEIMATLQWTKGTLFIWSCYCLVILNMQFLIQELLRFCFPWLSSRRREYGSSSCNYLHIVYSADVWFEVICLFLAVWLKVWWARSVTDVSSVCHTTPRVTLGPGCPYEKYSIQVCY